MRLWHQEMIPHLDRQRLLGQHRECCALRGRGWGRKHSTVDYVFTHPHEHLYAYHYLIMQEMKNRGYNVSPEWYDPKYRGKVSEPWETFDENESNRVLTELDLIYPEHNLSYLKECLENLIKKDLDLTKFFETKI